MIVESDLVQGFSSLIEGYDPTIRQIQPGATWLRWYAVVSFWCFRSQWNNLTWLLGSMHCINRVAKSVFQMVVGLVLVIDSFILSMQTTDVIELILNVTALFFIQEIDDIAFKLAETGTLSVPVLDDCIKLKNLKRELPKAVQKRRTLGQQVLMVVLIIGLMVSYGVILSWQLTGLLLCNHGTYWTLCLSVCLSKTQKSFALF